MWFSHYIPKQNTTAFKIMFFKFLHFCHLLDSQYQFTSVIHRVGRFLTHGLQHTRLPCPSPPAGACSNSCLSTWWCHPTVSSSVITFSSCLPSFPASGSFQMSQLLATSGLSIGVSASASVLPVNVQDWSPLGWTGWISCSTRDSQESFAALQLESINSLAFNLLYGEGNGNPLQYSCLENPIGGGAW